MGGETEGEGGCPFPVNERFLLTVPVFSWSRKPGHQMKVMRTGVGGSRNEEKPEKTLENERVNILWEGSRITEEPVLPERRQSGFLLT